MDDIYEYNDGGEALPPYERRRVSELAAAFSSVQELPSSLLMTSEISGQDVLELEAHSLYGIGSQGMSMETAENQGVSAHFEKFSKWDSPALGLPTRHPYAPLATPAYPPSLDTEQLLSATPEMTSREQSHDSSPVSLCTPTEDNARTHRHIEHGYSNMLSPHESLSPATGHQYVAEAYEQYPTQGYDWSPISEAAVKTSRVGRNGSSIAALGSFNNHQQAQFYSSPSRPGQIFAPYQNSSQQSSTSQRTLPNSNLEPDWRNPLRDFSTNTWQLSDDSRWYHLPVHEQELRESERTNQLPKDFSATMIPQSRNISGEMHQHVVAQTGYNQYETSPPHSHVEIAQMACDTCGKKFTGK